MEIFSTAVSAEFHHFPQFLSHSSDLSSGSAVTSATWTFPSWGSLQWWWPTLRGTFTWSCRTGRWQMTRWENSTFPSCRTMVSSSCGSQAGKETSTFFFFFAFSFLFSFFLPFVVSCFLSLFVVKILLPLLFNDFSPPLGFFLFVFSCFLFALFYFSTNITKSPDTVPLCVWEVL